MAKKIKIEGDGDYLADVFARAARCGELVNACEQLKEKLEGVVKKLGAQQGKSTPPKRSENDWLNIRIASLENEVLNGERTIDGVKRENSELRRKIAEMTSVISEARDAKARITSAQADRDRAVDEVNDLLKRLGEVSAERDELIQRVQQSECITPDTTPPPDPASIDPPA
jgi:chromosome segregation ATPase